jgi:DNA-binding NtrC family response regulator
VTWQPRGLPLALPVEECGTLVLQNIAALDGHDQARLRVWFDHPTRRTHVVSTTTYPVFPLVDCGVFDATLFYRLNVVRFSVDQDERDMTRVTGN